MPGLIFEDAGPSDDVSPNRADIACVIGFLSRRRTPLPATVIAWLFANGWPSLPGTLLEDTDLAGATVSPTVKNWLLANGWPNLQLYVASDLVLRTAVPVNVVTWLNAQAWPNLSPQVRADVLLENTPVPGDVKTWLLSKAWPGLDLVMEGAGMTLRQVVPPAVKDWLIAEGWPDLPLTLLDDTTLEHTSVPPSVKAWLLTDDAWPDSEIEVEGQDLEIATPLSDDQKTWLQAQGWREQGVPVRSDDSLLNTPIAVESFDAFDQLFAWEQRPATAGGFAYTTWMGAAVRSFFTQGGARLFVTRVGDPWVYAEAAANPSADEEAAAEAERNFRLDALLPGFTGGAQPSRNDRTTWQGIGILYGLEQVAMLGFPDLPEIVADAALDPTGLAPLPPSEEKFVECSVEIAPPPDDTRQISSSPACTDAGYAVWYRAVNQASYLLRNYRRDVELILALPLPAPGTAPQGDLMALIDRPNSDQGLAVIADGEPDGIATAFVQLAYPWLETTGSEALPGGLEPPDGVLTGVLARTVATLGTYRDAGYQALSNIHGFYPELSTREFVLDTPPLGRPAMIHRVSLLGQTPDGARVLSDVTTSLDAAHQPGCIGRLTAAIVRTARQIGEEVTFEPSGPKLWQQMSARLDRLMGNFFQAGALLGDSRSDAYSIRCDETTTSQNDLDNGRVIAEVSFSPAYPIGLITVVLALRESGVAAQGGVS